MTSKKEEEIETKTCEQCKWFNTRNYFELLESTCDLMGFNIDPLDTACDRFKEYE